MTAPTGPSVAVALDCTPTCWGNDEPCPPGLHHVIVQPFVSQDWRGWCVRCGQLGSFEPHAKATRDPEDAGRETPLSLDSKQPSKPGRERSPLDELAEVELRPLVVRWRVLRGITWWQHRRHRLTPPARETT